ncbi:MAG: hypothetical protein ACO3B3_09100 [Cyanobium sp.]
MLKTRVFVATLATAASVLIPQQAQALQVTTAFVPFQVYSNSALNSPGTLNFQNFSSVYTGPGILKSVGFKIAGNVNGTGSATASGNPRITNQSESDDITLTSLSYKTTLNPAANAYQKIVAGPTQNATSFGCVTTQSCMSPGGGYTIPSSSSRTLNLSGTYSGTSPSFVSLSAAEIAAFTTGTVTSTYEVAFYISPTTDIAPGWDPSLSASVLAKPNIQGFAALVYEYELPPAQTPGPLPLVGAAAAFGWSRRLRNRMAVA